VGPEAKGETVKEHEPFIRQCIDLAISAAKKGNHPFGALLVHDGEVILTAENTVKTDDDTTRHAELNLVVKSERAFPEEVLRESTLYTSTAPCLLCTAAIWSAGITRIVYCVSYETFATFASDRYRYIPFSEVFERLGSAVEAIGPVLEEEGVQAYQYWPRS
jgi:tRNA(Arg) A34 adenosine deaminase TadA